MEPKEFITDVKKLREQAKQQINKGPITKNYSANLKSIINLLNIALATELICVLRYKNHYFKAKQLGASVVAEQFLEHAQEEQAHADALENRIAQLGALPKMDPTFIAKESHSEYIECDTIDEMIKENLIAERIAIDSYRQMIQYIDTDDPTTRRVLEEILAVEEEHADDLLELKAEYNVKF